MKKEQNTKEPQTQTLNIPDVSGSTVYKWDKCCAEEFQRLWRTGGGSMNIISYNGTCPKCGHYIGLSQTSKQEVIEFLKKYELELCD